MIIIKDDIDVSKKEKSYFKKIYENCSYDDVKDFLRNNDYAIGLVINNTRAIEGKIFKKLYPKSSSTYITLVDGSKKKISLSLDVLVTCSYSVNVATEKISSISTPKISLDRDIVPGDTQNLQLVANKTNATKTNNDTWIKLDISYSIKTKHYYVPYQDIKMGPFSITDTIK